MICRICKQDKPETAEYYHRDKNSKNGLHTDCKECARKVIKKWQLAHPEKNLEYCARWKRNNREKARAESLAFEHPEKVTVLSTCKCDVSKKQNHHPDYSKPFDVIKLCPRCHIMEHIRLKRSLAATAVDDSSKPESLDVQPEAICGS